MTSCRDLAWLFILVIHSINGISQKYDNMWLFGYESSEPHSCWGGSNIDFNIFPPNIFKQERELKFNVTNGSICNFQGNLMFYTNGIYIANHTHQPMQNGNGINPGEYTDDHASFGLIIDQGALVLPFPNNNNQYVLFHETLEYPEDELSYHIDTFYASIIDMTLNNGLGAVIEKNIILIQDTLGSGKLTAVKHANGRDWWILIPEYNSNHYYRLLLNADGVSLDGQQKIGMPTPSGVGQAVFSPDGNKYIRNSLIGGASVLDVLDIYDFDRCTGLLSNHIQFEYADSSHSGGVAISPNSQFLYVPHGRFVFQFDLLAPDIPSSMDTVAIYDGFITPEFPVGTLFFLAQLAPNGKIYISSPSSTKYLHVINHPNQKGDACEVLQHSVKLPTFNAFSMPNFPHYRLGPLDGSPCDTLGINNHPLAHFTWQTDGLTAHFTDNSFYEPMEWHWTFEGGDSSNAINPSYTFPAEGMYEVCLAVSNQYSSDTLCQIVTISLLEAAFSYEAEGLTVQFMDATTSDPTEWTWDFGDAASSEVQHPSHTYVEEGVYQVCLTAADEFGSETVCEEVEVVMTGVEDIQNQIGMKVFPNPFTSQTTIYFEEPLSAAGEVVIFDALGKKRHISFEKGVREIAVAGATLRAGVYFFQVGNGVEIWARGKFIKY